MRLRRSMLIVPGSRPERIAKASGLACDSIVMDIEDGVAPAEKKAARRHIADAGYGEFYNHGLGHGLGLDIHEAPSLRWSSTEALRVGMVVTVEPGVYLPGIGGVRIEDDVLVTRGGCKVLTRLDKDLDSAVLNPGR